MIDKNLGLNPPIELQVTFIMDNAKIIPEDNILTIVADPVYYPFEDYIQEVNSTNIVKFEVKSIRCYSMNRRFLFAFL